MNTSDNDHDPMVNDPSIIRIEEKIDALLEKTNKIEKVMFLGNGTPSVLVRLTRLEESSVNTISTIKMDAWDSSRSYSCCNS